MDKPASKWVSVDPGVLPPLYSLDTLTEEQKQKVIQFKAGDAKPFLKPIHTDLYLLRWLMARSWDVDKATSMFIASMKWREENKVDSILEDFPKSPFARLICENYPSTHTDPKCKELRTKDGHHLVLERMGQINPESTSLYPIQDLINFHIYAMELGAKRRDEYCKEFGNTHASSTTGVEDLEGLGMAHMNTALLAVLKEFTKIDSDNYPESLRKVFIVNVPSVFNLIWKMVQYFWDENQKSKFQFLPAGTDLAPVLLQFIHEEDLPKAYGGKYDYDLPAKKSHKEFKFLLREIVPKKKWEKVHVPRGGSYEHPVVVAEGCQLYWEFKTKHYDVSFGVNIQDAAGELVAHIDVERVDSQNKTIEGSLVVKDPATYILVWDNTYSWTRGKDLKFFCCVFPSANFPGIKISQEILETATLEEKVHCDKELEKSEKKKSKSRRTKLSVKGSQSEKSASRSERSERSIDQSDRSVSERSDKSENKGDRSPRGMTPTKSKDKKK